MSDRDERPSGGDRWLKWILAAFTVLQFLSWLGVLRPMEPLDARMRGAEFAILDLQYGIKAIGNVNERLSVMQDDLAKIRLQLSAAEARRP